MDNEIPRELTAEEQRREEAKIDRMIKKHQLNL